MSERIQIPRLAWMRLKQRGSYKYSRKESPIVWQVKQPPKGATVYMVAWYSGQGILQASGTYVQP